MLKKVAILFFSLVLLLMLGCNKFNDWQAKQKEKEIKKNNKEWEDIYSKKLKKEINSEKKNNDTFLIFKFGDSNSEVLKKFKQLEKEGKVKVDENKSLYYEFVFDEYEFKNAVAYFNMQFSEGKLYKLTLIVESQKPRNTYTILLFHDLSDLYRKKYGDPDYYNTDALKNYEIRWIDGNQEIKIVQRINDVVVTYIDKTIEIKLETENQNKLENEIKSTVDDI